MMFEHECKDCKVAYFTQKVLGDKCSRCKDRDRSPIRSRGLRVGVVAKEIEI